MAIAATSVWEMRTTGAGTNGGFYKSDAGTTDYSQQDAAQWTGTNISSDGAGTAITDDDAQGIFTAQMVGNGMYITGGDGFTTGWYEITAFTDSDNVVIDRSAGASKSGGTGNIGGAIDNFTSLLLNTFVAGNEMYAKVGTYTLAGAVNATVDGTAALPIKVMGYNASRGDRPTGTDRPLIAAAANNFEIDNYWHFSNFRGTTTTANGFDFDTFTLLDNCHFNNSSGTAGRLAINLIGGQRSSLIDTEVQALNGTGVETFTNGVSIVRCFIHDCADEGINFGTAATITFTANTIIANNGIGIKLGSNDHHVLNCIIDNNTTGVEQATGTNSEVSGCQITSNTDGATGGSSQPGQQVFQDNNWFGNGTDVTNITKGTRASANDPVYTDDTNYNFENESTDVSGEGTVIAGSLTPNNAIRGSFQRAGNGGIQQSYIGC